MAIDFSFSSGGGFGYGHGAFFDFFYFASFEEVIIFMAVFMIGFIVAYTGLKKFFSEDQAPGYYPNKAGAMVYKKNEKAIRGKNALIVLSLCVALLMSVGLLRNGWLFHYFGNVFGVIISVMIALVGVAMISWAYVFLESNVGGIIAGILSGPVVWWFMSFTYPLVFGGYESAMIYRVYLILSSITFLVLLTLFFLVVGIYRHVKGIAGMPRHRIRP